MLGNSSKSRRRHGRHDKWRRERAIGVKTKRVCCSDRAIRREDWEEPGEGSSLVKANSLLIRPHLDYVAVMKKRQ